MKNISGRVLDVAKYLIRTGDTVRNIADRYGVSKSTIHKDLNDRLRVVDETLYKQVKHILMTHYQDKCYRGGQATQSKYARIRREREGA